MSETTIHSILEEFREAKTSNREMGDKFERLVQSYLLTDPLYKEKFKDVWLWAEWPKRGKIADTGIDLVAEERATGDYCAIQCKFYDPNSTLQKADIDSFFTASGKEPFTSRLIVSTTDKWGIHAEEALQNQKTPVSRLRIQDLAESPVDWSQFTLKKPGVIKLKEKKKLRDHQKEALAGVEAGFKKADRGKMIMACGTGKTFTALKIAEKMAGHKGHVLFLVPSISLISQTLREWTAEAEVSLHSFAVCSDTAVGKHKDSEDIHTHDLPFPATTDPKLLAKQLKEFGGKKELTVIFSTYQSIKVISEAQKLGAPDFDLIVCDEAHRTTGVSLAEEVAKGEESHFVKVHDQKFLKGDKRLYMTATPRIFSDDTKVKAQEINAELCSMDNEDYYGQEFYRLDFSEAVKRELLSDYKVLVLAVDKGYVESTLQKMFANENSELNIDDAVKITGCWNGLSKRFSADSEGADVDKDTGFMHRAVAFSTSIKASEQITRLFSAIVEQYRDKHMDDDQFLTCEVQHVDGTYNALRRNEKLDWLKEDTSSKGNVCRILSNARCLAEGVDVPALDAVMFLNPRNSVVDVVQSVGRVMRKAEGKKYGYIILPIGVPADMAPEEALKDNKKYKVVWQVLQALRAHDDRFKNMVNKIDLNKTRPGQVQIIGVGGGASDQEGDGKKKPKQGELPFPNFEDWKNAIYAKIVLKCGDRQYWEGWAKDVAEIAENHKQRIDGLLKGAKPKHKTAFSEFLKGLQDNINPSIQKDEAIEMLSQHLITKPVFDALFENYKFTLQNPVSLAMQKMLDILEGENLEKETEKLNKFYKSVAEKAKGVDNAEGKQKIVLELYDKFFRTAFPKMSERLGIVYTPIEVVDFIVKSADAALRQEFGVGLTDKGVNILDPFTGTGTFIVRLLQNGLIKPEDLKRKFREELHANEIVLLAYYIAAINIEEAYHGIYGGGYEPFDGIVLTDTFQMSEPRTLGEEVFFPVNNLRVVRQKKKDIRVIIGNPPYSAGQSNENDDNKNLDYPFLDKKISDTYVKYSSSGYMKNLYDSYIRAFRWASDRIGKSGVVCFVSNGSYIDGASMDGFRKCLTDDFTSIYCFNLRGNARTSGELRRKEKDSVFGQGTRTSIALTLLIKNPEKSSTGQIFYHDIGDYLNRDEKLGIIKDFDNFINLPWVKLHPNSNNDWINQRDPAFDKFIPLGDKDARGVGAIFSTYSMGVLTSRDSWVYGFSEKLLGARLRSMIAFYNSQMESFKAIIDKHPKKIKESVEDFIDNDPKQISWSRALKNNLRRFVSHKYRKDALTVSAYRPFCKQWLYYDKYFNEMIYQTSKLFPEKEVENFVICVSGVGATKGFSALITNHIPNYHLHDTAQNFPLKFYSVNEVGSDDLFTGSTGLSVRDGITDWTLNLFREEYKYPKISKEDIFYYVYGILHSPEYKTRFSSDLAKMIPRIPYAKDFWAFSKAGRDLAKWHLEYETVKPYPLEESKDQFELNPKEFYKIAKMSFGKKDKQVDKTTIIYNSHLTLKGIPLEAYEYVVNGRPALEWIMERYQFAKDPDSQITNDPNDWSDDPKYIVNLVKRIVTVSLETMKIVNSLPPLNEKK